MEQVVCSNLWSAQGLRVGKLHTVGFRKFDLLSALFPEGNFKFICENAPGWLICFTYLMQSKSSCLADTASLFVARKLSYVDHTLTSANDQEFSLKKQSKLIEIHSGMESAQVLDHGEAKQRVEPIYKTPTVSAQFLREKIFSMEFFPHCKIRSAVNDRTHDHTHEQPNFSVRRDMYGNLKIKTVNY